MDPKYATDQPAGYKNRIEKVAFVGAGGQSGKWIAQELLKNPQFEITAITRPSSGNTIPSGVHHIAKVDYDDEARLVDVLKGHDVLIITLAVTVAPGTHDQLVHAASKAGISWIVPNEFGNDGSDDEQNKATVLGIRKAKERAVIEAAGMSWLGVACGFWFEFSLGGGPDYYGFDIPKRKALFFDEGETRLSTSTFPQVGRAVAALLALPILPKNKDDRSLTLEYYRNKFIHFASFTLNQKEMLSALQKATNTTEKDWSISKIPVTQYYTEALKEMQGGSVQDFRRVLYSRAFYPEEPVNMEKTYGLDNDKLGLPKDDLDEFARLAVKMAEEGYIEKQYGRRKN